MAVFKALWVTEAPHGVYETQVVERDTGDAEEAKEEK